MKEYCFIFFFLASTFTVKAQSAMNAVINKDYDGVTIMQALYDIEQNYDIRFMFRPENLPTYSITVKSKDKQIWESLNEILKGSKLKPVPYGEKTFVIVPFQGISKTTIEEIANGWTSGTYGYPVRKEAITIQRTYGSVNSSSNDVSLKVTLFDAENNEPVIGALVYTDDYSVNASSGVDGMVNLLFPSGSHKINISYTGYVNVLLDVNIFESASEIIRLEQASYILDEINITADAAKEKLENNQTGIEVIDIERLEAIPQIMGDADIIKSLELLPGVSSTGELTSGFNVRGGSVDENLVLLDGGIIFNPTHVGGFISAFNSDIIQSATLYKGYINPEFGGRSSSVLDLKTHTNFDNDYFAKGSVGLNMSKIAVQKQISNKLHGYASIRGSFSDWILGSLADATLANSNVSFYDSNLGLTYTPNSKLSFTLSGYISDDFLEYNDDFGFEWSNKMISLRSRYEITKKWNTFVTLSSGGYTNTQFDIDPLAGYKYSNAIRYNKGLINNIYSVNDKINLKLGVEFVDFTVDPESISPFDDQSNVIFEEIQRNGNQSFAGFLGLTYDINENLGFDFGIRRSQYQGKGESVQLLYSNDEFIPQNITDTLLTDSYQSISFWEPRISIKYGLNDHYSIKASYNRLSQNAQLLTLGNTSLPTDLWIFSNDYISPRVVDQYSTGVYYNNTDLRQNFSVELFYKDITNPFILRDFPEVVLNPFLETEVIGGTGRTSGVEIYAQKSDGILTGTISYTYSKSLVYPDESSDLAVVSPSFVSNIDIPHKLNLNLSYAYTPTLSFNLAYVYKSGRPITSPSSTLNVEGFLIPLYGERNSDRIPSYSRWDISMTLDQRKIKKGGFKPSFTLGLYNVLARDNAYNVYYRRGDRGNIQGFQFSLIGSMIPSLTMGFIIG